MAERGSHHDQEPQAPHKPEALVKLENRWNNADTLLCVGLDSEIDKFPDFLKQRGHLAGTIMSFNYGIIDATKDVVCAYKPNIAFYEAEGNEGLTALSYTMRYLQESAPDVLRLLDAKRGDIGNTNKGYVRGAFEDLGAEAITLAPYLGGSIIKDGERRLGSLEPFLADKDKMSFILVRTSNPDAGDLQDLSVDIKDIPQTYKEKFGDLKDLRDKISDTQLGYDLQNLGYAEGHVPLYLITAYKVAKEWNANGNLGMVVGATYPQELSWVRQVVGDIPILMPGLGSQGGDAEASVKAGIDSKRQGLVVNSSSGIIFAGKDANFGYANKSRDAAIQLRETINIHRKAA